jgi:hypothetical protein
MLRAFLVTVLEPTPFNNPEWGNLLYGLEMLVLLCTWAGFYFAYDYSRRYEAAVVERRRF